MKKSILLSLALCGTMSLSVQAQSEYENPNWKESETKMATAQVLTFEKTAPRIMYFHDVNYVSRHGLDLKLQILRPEGKPGEMKKLPCIVFIPGSAWFKQNVYFNLPTFAKFAERGYVIALVEYTHSEVAPFPAPLQDVKTAIRFMRKEAERYGVDVNNLFVWGDSSGGHMSLMSVLTADQPAFDTDVYGEYPISVNACIAYYPVTDIKNIHIDPNSTSTGKSDSPEGMLLGKVDIDTHKPEADAASPVTYVSREKPIPPILIATGTCDHVLPFSQSEIMVDALEKAEKEHVYYVLKGADHGSWEFWSPKMLDLVNQFIQKYIQ